MAKLKWRSIVSTPERVLFGKESLHADLANKIAYLPSVAAKRALPFREIELAKPTTQTAAAAELLSVLPQGYRINGHIYISSPMLIDCEVNGQIIADGLLTIAKHAYVNASVIAASVKVEGQVVGDIVASQRIELMGSARVDGNLKAARIIIHEHAVLNGKCDMKAD